jgi:hypothetical protein
MCARTFRLSKYTNGGDGDHTIDDQLPVGAAPTKGGQMFTAALTWPEAVVVSVSVITVGLVLSVIVWQIFRTGQTAIKTEGTERGAS